MRRHRPSERPRGERRKARYTTDAAASPGEMVGTGQVYSVSTALLYPRTKSIGTLTSWIIASRYAM